MKQLPKAVKMEEVAEGVYLTIALTAKTASLTQRCMALGSRGSGAVGKRTGYSEAIRNVGMAIRCGCWAASPMAACRSSSPKLRPACRLPDATPRSCSPRVEALGTSPRSCSWCGRWYPASASPGTPVWALAAPPSAFEGEVARLPSAPGDSDRDWALTPPRPARISRPRPRPDISKR